MVWEGPHRLRVGSESFSLIGPQEPSVAAGGRSTDPADLRLFKPRSFVDEYLALATRLQPRRVVELGIFEGGSTAFLHELLPLEAMLAVDITPTLPEALARHLDRSDDPEVVRCHLGVDQADRTTIADLVLQEVGTPLDLVIDDASHQLRPTVASFEVLFPLVRPGGVYVIEDWSAVVAMGAGIERRSPTGRVGGAADDGSSPALAALVEAAMGDPTVLEIMHDHAPDHVADLLRTDDEHIVRLRTAHPELVASIVGGTRSPRHTLAGDGPRRGFLGRDLDRSPVAYDDLSALVLHLVQAAIQTPSLVASVRVRRGMAIVTRGPAAIDPVGFDVRSLAASGLRWPDASTT